MVWVLGMGLRYVDLNCITPELDGLKESPANSGVIRLVESIIYMVFYESFDPLIYVVC